MLDSYDIHSFDERNPFATVRAEDFGDSLFEFYEPLEPLLKDVSGVDIKDPRPLFLIGGRGSGKTMVLKYLSLRMQIEYYVKNSKDENIRSRSHHIEYLPDTVIKKFLKEQKFIGVYLHFRTTEYESIKSDLANFFLPYLALKFSEQLFLALCIIKRSNAITKSQENEIISYFLKQLKNCECRDIYTFEDLLKVIIENQVDKFETLFEKSSYYSFKDLKNEFEIPVIMHKNLFFGLPKIIFNLVDSLHGKKLFVLLDELEFLQETHIKSIGKLIKDSDETPVVFKIGSRYMPPVIQVGNSREVLQIGHDYRKINITDALNTNVPGHRKGYSQIIKKILNKRLEKSTFFQGKGITNIEKLFPEISFRDEALELVTKKKRKMHWVKFENFLQTKGVSEDEIKEIRRILSYPKNPLIEKLNMLLYYRGEPPEKIALMYKGFLNRKNSQYAILYNKFDLNLLFQLHYDYKSEKKYAGINTFILLSSGIVRHAIELCNQALNFAYFYGFDPSQEKFVKTVYQDMAAKKIADEKYEDICGISKNLGFKVQNFIEDFGTIFHELHLNPYIFEPEPTHFEIKHSEISGEAKNTFDSALEHSYLQEKDGMSPDKNELTLNDYVINRIFAPKFEISYRTRGRTFVTSNQIKKLIESDPDMRKEIRREIINKNSKKMNKIRLQIDSKQKTLFDLVGNGL